LYVLDAGGEDPPERLTGIEGVVRREYCPVRLQDGEALERILEFGRRGLARPRNSSSDPDLLPLEGIERDPPEAAFAESGRDRPRVHDPAP